MGHGTCRRADAGDGTGRDGSYADGTSKLMSSKSSRSHPSGLGPQVSGLRVQGTAMAHPPPASRVIESPVWLAKLFCAPFGFGRLFALLSWSAGSLDHWIAGYVLLVPPRAPVASFPDRRSSLRAH